MLKFILFLLFLSPLSHARIIVISDIDETIKINRGMNARALLGYLKGESYAYPEMEVFYEELHDMGAEFLYLSSSFDILYDGDNWIRDHGFPAGKVIQRNEDSYLDGKYFKEQELNKIFEGREILENDYFFFLGDNFGEDEIAYSQIVAKYKLQDKSLILIRDMMASQILPALELKEKSYPLVRFYISGRDLVNALFPLFFEGKLSFDALLLMPRSYYQRVAFTTFQKELFKNRLRSRYCLKRADSCEAFIGRRMKALMETYYYR